MQTPCGVLYKLHMVSFFSNWDMVRVRGISDRLSGLPPPPAKKNFPTFSDWGIGRLAQTLPAADSPLESVVSCVLGLTLRSSYLGKTLCVLSPLAHGRSTRFRYCPVL